MTIFLGTDLDERIGPDFVSASVSPNTSPTDLTDELHGAGGNDTLVGGNFDKVYGGMGDDLIDVSLGPEIADGRQGIDTLDSSGYDFDYRINLATGETTYVDEIFANFEHLITGAVNDTLIGSGYANALYGGNGRDTLYGGGGDDSQYGGTGDDLILPWSLGVNHADGGEGIDTPNTNGVESWLQRQSDQRPDQCRGGKLCQL